MVQIWKNYYLRYETPKPKLPRLIPVPKLMQFISECYKYAWRTEQEDVKTGSEATFEDYFYQFCEIRYRNELLYVKIIHDILTSISVNNQKTVKMFVLGLRTRQFLYSCAV